MERLKLASRGEIATTWIMGKWHLILSLNLSGMNLQSFILFFPFSSCSLLSSISILCRYLQA